MKTTRRGWLTAFSSLIALPLLPESGTASAEPTPAPRSLADYFAGLSYRKTPDPWPGREFWEGTVRVPVTEAELRARKESLRDDLHYLRTCNAGHYATELLETELREIDTARALLALLSSGRPITFRYSGGSTPGQVRTVLPTLVFHTEPTYPPGLEILGDMTPAEFHEPRRLYLQAYCLERLAPRTFRLERIQKLTPLSSP